MRDIDFMPSSDLPFARYLKPAYYLSGTIFFLTGIGFLLSTNDRAIEANHRAKRHDYRVEACALHNSELINDEELIRRIAAGLVGSENAIVTDELKKIPMSFHANFCDSY